MKCANCGALIDPDSHYCKACGRSVTPGTENHHHSSRRPEPRKKSTSALQVILIVLAVLGLLAAAYLLYWDKLTGGPNETHNFQTEYTYVNRPGEESYMSVRRSRLETMEALLAKTPSELEFEFSLPLAYCLLNFSVGEPRTDQTLSYGEEGGRLIRPASAKITDREFRARQDFLQTRPDFQARIWEAGNLLQQRKSELLQAEFQLGRASKGLQEQAKENELFTFEEDPDLMAPQDSLPRIDSSMAEALNAYDAALTELEAVYESLNDIKEELAALPSNGE